MKNNFYTNLNYYFIRRNSSICYNEIGETEILKRYNESYFIYFSNYELTTYVL